MKNFLFLLCILSLCFGCDKAYDLNKIESGDVTIGNDQSEWIMPLAQITVGMDELQDGSADIRAIFDEVDIWLPTTLPGNAEWVDIVRLSSDGTYLDGMLEALIDEMLVPGSKKMDEVVDLIWSNEGYRERFSARTTRLAKRCAIRWASWRGNFFPRLKSIRLLIMRRWMSTMI